MSGQLLIQGNRLTIYSDELTTDADQTINIGERARVRTCFGGPSVPCGSVQAGDPRIAGLVVQAELRGPELPQAISLRTVPGGTFFLPAFQQEGDYRLENIRLVNAATGQVLGSAEPSLAVLHVREIVLARATVTALSLEDLQARGIQITEENFQAYNFAVGFALEDEIVEIEFPVVYSGNGVLQPVLKPKVMLDGLPPDVIAVVARWQPPQIVPFKLEKAPGRDILDTEAEVREDLAFPLFGAIVIPGNLTFLNQFFDAQLVVANGAPAGSGVSLEKLRGVLKLPQGNVLRLAKTDPPVAPGQEVPIAKADGGRTLQPGQQGAANWTVEGLLPGTHVLQMDILGELARPGRDPLPILSRAQAAVEVVDARFNLTFSHPDVVREGEEYTLFVTVSNLSSATQNLVKVEIKDEYITGAHKADPHDDFLRTIDVLEPGRSETVEFELVSDLNGRVVATTFQSDSIVVQGTIRLRTGVGELGIPLSPATLVMPRFTEYIRPPYTQSDELVKATVRLLGLGYSVAVAPGGLVPPGVPRVIKSDIERRAVDLAEAGQRVYLQEQMLETLSVLALDQLGNRHHLEEYDQLRRRTNKGLRAAARIADQWRYEQGERGLDAVDFLDVFAETTSYARPWMAALWVPDDPAGGSVLELRGPDDTGGPGVLAHPADDEDKAERSLPYGEVYSVAKTSSGTDTVPFALVGHADLATLYQVALVNETINPQSGRLIVVVPDGDTREYRRIDYGRVTVPAMGELSADVGAGVPDPGFGGFRLEDTSGSPVGQVPARNRVPLPPFRVIGARQDFRLAEEGPDIFGNMIRPNRYGSGLTYLFNRPPDRTAAETPENYHVFSTFDGLDILDEPTQATFDKVATGAFFQENSERVVNVRFSGSIAALIGDDDLPLVHHEQELDTLALVDEFGNSLDPDVPAPIVETIPLHVGGLVTGRVVHGTGDPAPGTKVELIRPRWVQTLLGEKVMLDLAGTVTTDSEGRFFFEYVENPNWDKQVDRAFTLRATVPEGDDPELEPAQVQEISSIIRRQNRMARINIQLLGRGTIQGKLVFLDNQQPVPEGRVSAASVLFQEVKSVQVDPDGSFRIPSLPVGPITLTGADKFGNLKVYATVGIDNPGDVVDVYLEIQRNAAPEGQGTVVGNVLRYLDGEKLPAYEAKVACYSDGRFIGQRITDEEGRFRFDKVPEGRVSLQAADFRISRTAAFSDFVLTDGQILEAELVIPESSARTVTGKVFFDDPVSGTLQPVEGAVAFIKGPGNYAYTDENGEYRIEGVPVQGTTDSNYQVTVIDNTLHLEESVGLPPILDVSEDVIVAPTIVLSGIWEGGIDGVVLDPLGRPLPFAELVLLPYEEKLANGDGTFSFDNVPVGDYTVTAHIGNGLQPGQVGYIGDARTRIIYGGHRPFVTIRMRGSGIVNVHTRTATSTGILTPIFYRPTYFSEKSLSIAVRGEFTETSTDPNGRFQVELPVGDFELVAFNPFHGIREINGKIEYPGQVVNLDILFEDAGTVRGQVVDVDGRTPVPDIEVTLFTKTLKPQTQRTDAQGGFAFFLVPKGGVTVTAHGLVGTVERVGRVDSGIFLGGQEIDLFLELKAQGSVRGQVKERFNETETVPLPFAQFFVREMSFPYRRLPPDDKTYFSTDGEGRYQVSHVYAGRVEVVARDRNQVTRMGSERTEITADWQVANVPDIVMETSVGTLHVIVRDPQTGGPLADAQVRLSNADVLTTDAEGRVRFEALPLGVYSVYAFNAATGQSGRQGNVNVSSPGQEVTITIFLDQRGEILGTLFDDEDLLFPVPGGTVSLSGSTTNGRLSALATTSGREETLGRFAFGGIPEGEFSLLAAVKDSPRLASALVELTETALVADINMVLEPAGDKFFRIYEKLQAGIQPIDVTSGLYSLRVTQASKLKARALAYDFTQIQPLPGDDVFFFPDLLLERAASVSAQELGGEQRSQSFSLRDLVNNVNNPVEGTGTIDDPYQVVLKPKGTVVVHVRDANGNPVPDANVTLGGIGGSVTGPFGSVTFFAVRAGGVTASGYYPPTKSGGIASGTLTYDDQVLELTVTLAPTVSAHGIVYQPVPDDRLTASTQLVPMEGAIVEIKDSKGRIQVRLTEPDGTYRFDVLATGGYTLNAQNNNGDQMASTGGSLNGPDGADIELPSLLLDAGPPRILSIVPPPGIEGVSRMAAVEIVFSEALLDGQAPTGQATSFYFTLRSESGALATGNWTSFLDADGRQVVRFVPTVAYENTAVYGLTIKGGNGGLKDRAGRKLTESGDVGSNFKTSDSVGPEVIGTLPSLDQPVDPKASIRIDFNEAVVATAEQLDGDGVGDAALLQGQRGDGVWVTLPVVLFLTRSNYSIQVDPIQGLVIEGDTLRRRLVVSGLVDSIGNPMPTYQKEFRVFDESVPVLEEVLFPTNAPDGNLVQGVDYTIVPVISNVADVTPEDPGGDVARVEYFFADPENPANPQTPSYSSVTYPFGYSFIGAYQGDGVEPRPFPVWARAVDTSTNESQVVRIDMQVLPNAPPTLGSVTAQALQPVSGTFYAGSQVRAVVGGLDDQDGTRLTLSVELRADGESGPVTLPLPGRLIERPASGWQGLAPPVFEYEIPIETPEGTPLYFYAKVIDQHGAVAEAESERFPVADDAAAPRVDSIQAKEPGGFGRFVFFIGDELEIEFRSSDFETDVSSVEVSFDREDIFPSGVAVSKVAGTTDRYRTETLSVPPDVFFEATPVVVTVKSNDYGGNTGEQTLTFDVAPEADPNAPEAAWLTPWQGAAWPAGYSSTSEPVLGVPFLLRAAIVDTLEDEAGNVGPGQIVSVKFRGPVRTESGEIELAPDWVEAELLAGTGGPGSGVYQFLWNMPNQVAEGTPLPFAVRAVDSGGSATVAALEMAAVRPRRVYEKVQTSVSSTDPMLLPPVDGEPGGDPEGPVFLLNEALLSLEPPPGGAPRVLPGLVLYAGGEIGDLGEITVMPTVLTAPEITSFSSAVIYKPLDLEITNVLAVGHGAAVSVDAKGLLGSTTDAQVVLPGETAAQRYAGGSHGGRGWYGSPSSGWNRSDLTQPGSVYDSLRDPSLPGGGGRSDRTGEDIDQAGGAGGGVLRIIAPTATVRLIGDLTARGGNPKSTSGTAGGGAGGTIRLVVGRLEGEGLIDASGGHGNNPSRTGGGGGGRVSVSWVELAPEVDLDAQLLAWGGHNSAANPANAQRRAGAGTVYVEALDPATFAPLGPGRVLLANASGLLAGFTTLPALGDVDVFALDAVAATVTLATPRVDGNLVGDSLVLEDEAGAVLGLFPITAQERVLDASAPGNFRVVLTVTAAEEALAPIAALVDGGGVVRGHGRTHLVALSARGATNLLAEDDVVLGPAGAGVLNDSSQITLDDEAAVLLRGQGPVLGFTTDPAAGAEVRVGSTLTLSWTGFDPFGLVSSTETYSLTGETTPRTFSSLREVTVGPLALEVPADTAAGPVSFTVEATDVVGRVTTAEVSWTVLPNAAPTGNVAVQGGGAAEVKAGYPIALVAHAEDLEGLTALELLVSGPVVEVPPVVALDGLVQDVAFELTVPADASGAEPLTVQALVTDTSGAQTLGEALVVTVLPNEVPAITLAIPDGAPTAVAPGETTTFVVHAEDPDGLVSVEFLAAGQVTPTSQLVETSETSLDTTFDLKALDEAVPGTAIVTVVAVDVFGRTFTTAPFELPLVEDATGPAVELTLGSPDPYGAGEVVQISATASDGVGVSGMSILIDGAPVASVTDATSIAYTWTTPGVAAPTQIEVRAEATDPAGNVGSASQVVTVDPLVNNVPPAVAFDCPSGGAFLPSGYDLGLDLSSSDDLGVAKVELYRDDETVPFAVFFPEVGTPASFPVTTTVTLPVVSGTSQAVRFRAVAYDASTNTATDEVTVQVVETVDLDASEAANDWPALEGATTVLRSGTLTLTEPRTLGGLIVLPGAVITHPVAAPGAETSLDLSVGGPVYVACGGSISGRGQGYAVDKTYPGASLPGTNTGGSHVGYGGLATGPLATTYGSVYRPREPGGGGQNGGGRGGGVVRLEAQTLVVDGSVDADGVRIDEAGAGGSLWVTTGSFSGHGALTASGGPSRTTSYGAGGGGAIVLEYQTATVEALSNLRAWGGSGGTTTRNGGTGTIVLRGPSSVYGDLVLRSGPIIGQDTHLPALGAGVAQPSSGGATLLTGLTQDVPAYFVGHWVEVWDGTSGDFEGAYQVQEIAGTTLTLAPLPGETVSVDPGDLWQGAYYFDNATFTDDVFLESEDPIRVVGTLDVLGRVELREVSAGSLTLRQGATVKMPQPPGGAAPQGLTITVAGELLLEDGAAIDVSGQGYDVDRTYPGAGLPGTNTAGSHMGVGGVATNPAAGTFGSVYRPREAGGGGQNGGGRGGAALRIVAGSVTLAGPASAIRANGLRIDEAGAGGSVWITADDVSGDGVIEARGGDARTDSYGAGGGGAIAVDYKTSTGSVLRNLRAWGGNGFRAGGAGTVYLFGPSSVYGDLVVDPNGVQGQDTILPAMGGGVAQSGSGGAVLVTGTGVPAYFAGHWVELTAADGTPKGTFRVSEVSGGTVTLEPGGAPLTVEPGDLWQGVYLFDNYEAAGVLVRSADPIQVVGTQELHGTVQTAEVRAERLVITSGSVLTLPPTDGSNPRGLLVEVGELVIEDGAAIDVSARGYSADQTYPGTQLPGTNTGGSHMGVGGLSTGPLAGTFGSVYRPREAGGGGQNGSGRGGAAVRIVADSVLLAGPTSVIRTNGVQGDEGGAGGSVWITAGDVSGGGVIEARGGNARTDSYGAGGGGAIAIEYQTSSGSVLQNLRTWGGSGFRAGGPGTVYLFGPLSDYGDLLVDAGPVTGQRTELPALGGGTAQPGSGGTTLVIDRPTDVPAYFVGHWVELSAADGTPKGTFRIAQVSGTAVTLSDGSASLAIEAGDSWRGVYLFDDVRMTGADMRVLSSDPILTTRTQSLAGRVSLDEVRTAALVIETGSTLTLPPTDASAPASLRIDVSGALLLQDGAVIDVSALGYGADQTYPDTQLPGTNTGGSHLGIGGLSTNPLAGTFGSVYRPREAGGGGQNGSGRGGAAVRIVAGSVTFASPASAIRANGVRIDEGGAGGSVWITADAVSGDGVIEARGGDARTSSYGAGGGGAIAVEYQATTGSVLQNLFAWGGAGARAGGAGTVVLFGPSSVYGDLLIDDGPVASGRTELPAMGGGVAQAGSGGAVLVTAAGVPAYFAGHWVELTAADGTPKGTWRVAAAEGTTVTLEPGTSVVAGDLWQGVYLFDSVRMLGTDLRFDSADPLRVMGPQELGGTVELWEVEAQSLTLLAGSTLTLPPTSGTDPESLRIDVSGALLLEDGAAIDVSAQGYVADRSYPGAGLPGTNTGGSHLGVGGLSTNPLAGTFGSVYRPREAGGGGQNGSGRGGATVRIEAGSVTFAGPASAIRANGVQGDEGGAGGSVWITAGDVSGDGVIEARGGDARTSSYGAGGGGAITVEYQTSTGSVLQDLHAWGGAGSRAGGAGTVYLRSAGIYGDLVVDNNDVAGQATELPPLGSGIAQAGSAGDVLVTDRASPIPAYFAGHWVQLPTGFVRVASVDGVTLTLEDAGEGPPQVAEGDAWQGAYRFDAVAVIGGANLVSADGVFLKSLAKDGSLVADLQGPSVDPAAITVTAGEVPGTWTVRVPPAAVADADGVSEVRLAGAASWTSAPFSDETGAVLTWLGRAGEVLDLVVFDAHEGLRLGTRTRLLPLAEHGFRVAAEALPRSEAQPRLATANGYLLAAYVDRLVVADPTSGDAWTLRFGDGASFVDLETGATVAAVAVAVRGDDGEEEIRVLDVPLTGVGTFEDWQGIGEER